MLVNFFPIRVYSSLLLLNCNYITLVLNNAALCFKIGQQLFKNISILMWKSFSLACLPESCSLSFFPSSKYFLQQFDTIFFRFLRIFWVGIWLGSFFFSLLWRIVNALVVRVKTDLELYKNYKRRRVFPRSPLLDSSILLRHIENQVYFLG